MSRKDLHDRMIDQLLREILGGDRPRDMTARVMHQARIIDRFRRRAWWGGGSAIAAALALMIGLYFFWPREHAYPSPTIDGGISVADDMLVQRGATFYTQEKEGHMGLGGYVTLAMAPETQLNLGGSQYQEKVLLNRGELDVDVTKHKGQFDVAIGPATVHVTGTRFKVRVGQEETPTESRKMLYLAVKEGSVEVQDLPNLAGNQAASQTVTPDEGERKFVLASIKRVLNGGMLAAAQQSARVGARGGMVNNVTPRVPPANASVLSNPGPAYIPPAPGPALVPLTGDGTTNQPVQLKTTPAAANRIGHVMRAGTIYYLETKDGNFYMFERATVAALHPDWVAVPADQYSRVIWAEGLVSRMEKYAPATATTATQPH